MEMQELLKKVEELKIVPVVVLEDAKDALPLGQALIDGGLPVAEVTFRTAAAADSIKAMSEAFPEMLVGAGTVVQAGNRVWCKVHRNTWIFRRSYNILL